MRARVKGLPLAGVFLSYDRQDSDKARIIALALEKAGHSVWWDRHIKGGAQYSKEIERELVSADAVVVLWSEHAVESAWVRDEAASGRDRGKLVPARLDSAEPPLGFRQYQTVDLSRLTNRGRSPAIVELTQAVEALGEAPQQPQALAPVARARPERFARPKLIALAVAALSILGAAAILLWQPWRGSSAAPIVAVAPADGSASTRALVRSLFVQLGALQSEKSGMLQLAEPGSDIAPDLTLKVGASANGDRRRAANVALIDEQASTLLWSKEFEQPDGNDGDLRQQVAYTTAQVLKCTSEALSHDDRGVGRATLKLYLSGCADLSNLLAENPRVLIGTFRKVTEQAPTFAGGWAKLIVSEVMAHRLSGLKDDALRRDLRTHISQARKLHPTIAEPYMAGAWLQPPRPISGWMRFTEKAVEVDPENSNALSDHATGMFHVGRMQDAVQDTRRAVQFDPLSPAARDALIEALLHAGEVEAARRELREAERLWPRATNVVASRFALEFRYGDPREALRIARSGALPFSLAPARESYLQARINPSPAAIERAVTDARTTFERTQSDFGHYVQTLAEFGRDEELVRALLSIDPAASPGVIAVLFRPAFKRLHNDRRFMLIAKRFGLIDYWKDSGKWADFCFRPDLSYDCKAEAAKITA